MNSAAAEKAFQMNLIRLSGSTSAVSIDHMFEFLVYTNSNSVHDVQFVEEIYTDSIFNNQQFLDDASISICSLQIIFDKYQEAIKNNDSHFLKLLHDAHRQARVFLNDQATKARLKEIANQRKTQNEYQAYMNILSSIVGFMTDFSYNHHLNVSLTTMLPQLFANVRLIEGGNSESERKE